MTDLPDLPDAVAALLLDYELTDEERESINPFWLIDLEFPLGPCPVWTAHSTMLVPHFAKRHPGKRPSRWWKYDAPRQPGLPVDSLFELPGSAWAVSARPCARFLMALRRDATWGSRASGS